MNKERKKKERRALARWLSWVEQSPYIKRLWVQSLAREQPGWGMFGNESMFSSLFLPLSLKLINIPLDKDFKKTFKEEKQKVYKES